MRRTAIVLATVLAASCGGAMVDGAGTKDLSKFLGAPWSGSLTTTVTCAGAVAPFVQTDAVTLALSEGSGADLQFTSAQGCLFKFNATGGTARLANGPVACHVTVEGFSVDASITTFTLTTSDGKSLAVNAGGTATAGGLPACPAMVAGTLTR